MSDKEDDIFIEGAKRIKQLIQEQNIKPMDIINALDASRESMSKWLQNSTPSSAQSLIELARLVGLTERWSAEGKNQAKADLKPNPNVPPELDVTLASVDQLLAEIKARYAALNLKAEIKISVTPLDGGFVSKDGFEAK